MSMKSSALTPHFSNGSGGLLAAAGFVFVSYAGVTKIAAIAEEVRDPSRNIPLGILLSLLIMVILYVLISLVLVTVVPSGALGRQHNAHSIFG